ncbi:transposase [Moorena sp. SIO4G3]|uniref:REP-associated tyrosine transposase n=1 Tax=Moorena sp. SIO4G3 TaxID=2607821 RepID=UPI0025E0BF6F|nr:transposase [Moorena sp. SIO4G3]
MGNAQQSTTMPEYRRAYVPGGTFFLTLVTYHRTPLFSEPETIAYLRAALAKTRTERPFEISGAVVLPDHLHFLWTLPPGDTAYSYRVSRFKVLFTRSLRGKKFKPQNVSASRLKHRESNVWQRRFWEHVIRDESDFQQALDYIHYNPVKHGLVSCPHRWEYSSFTRWVETGQYQIDWGCSCRGRQPLVPDFSEIGAKVGE